MSNGDPLRGIRPQDDRASAGSRGMLELFVPYRGYKAPFCGAGAGYLMWTPEIAREMTRRWISEVPSKIV